MKISVFVVLLAAIAFSHVFTSMRGQAVDQLSIASK
jgi:hypothetical protein